MDSQKDKGGDKIYFDGTDRENGCVRVIPQTPLHKKIATHNKNP